MRRFLLLTTTAASLLGLAVFINPAIGIPPVDARTTPPSRRGGGTAGTGAVVGDVVTLDAQLSNTHLLQGSDGNIFLELTLTGQERERITAPHRLPMNLAIVIDRSGSMQSEDKLTYAKQAAAFLVGQLLPTDRVSLIAYDHNVQLLLGSQLVGDGTEITQTIHRLEPGGNTNLHGGMIAGAEQVKRHLAAQQVNRVILLSDGLANVGVADTPTLGRIAQSWGSNGVAITAMGVGLDFNEDLMLSLAEYSGGNYYYIDAPTKLAQVFERELSQLVATVAQDATVRVTLADGVRCLEVPGYTYQQAGQTLTIPLGDLAAGATRHLLVKLHVPTDAAGDYDVAQCRVEYVDGEDGRRRDFTTAMLGVERTESTALVEQNRNVGVLEQSARVRAAQVVQKAVGYFEAGRPDEAQALLDSERDALRTENEELYRSEDLDRQVREMETWSMEIANAPAPESAEGKSVRKRAKAQAYQDQK